YIQGRGALRKELKKFLRQGRIKRQRQSPRQGPKKGKLIEMVNISERPAEANDRAVPGHWEGDLIMGKLNKSAIGNLVERSARCVGQSSQLRRIRALESARRWSATALTAPLRSPSSPFASRSPDQRRERHDSLL